MHNPALSIPTPQTAPATNQPVPRLTSASLMQGAKEIEIAHADKIYRLRVTQLNKLILTA